MFSKLGSYMSGIIQHIVTTDFKNQVYSFCPILHCHRNMTFRTILCQIQISRYDTL